jgi:hypothetical protein
MNYYEAFEAADKKGKPTGKFHFTKTNDNITLPIGYCANNECNHKSKIEASDCYRKYIREQCNNKLPGGFDMESEDGTEMYFFGSY